MTAQEEAQTVDGGDVSPLNAGAAMPPPAYGTLPANPADGQPIDPEIRETPRELQIEDIAPLDATRQASTANQLSNVEDVPAAPSVVPLHRLGDVPQMIDCPYCERRTITRLDKKASAMTVACGVFLGFLCICAACLPCIMGCFQDVEYRCSHCNRIVAEKPNDGQVRPLAVYKGDASEPSRYFPVQQGGAQVAQPKIVYAPRQVQQENGKQR